MGRGWCVYIWKRAEPAGAGSDWRGALLESWRRSWIGRKITLVLIKGSDLQADLACGYVDRAEALEPDSGPGADRQSDGRAEGLAHEHTPHQRGYGIEK